MITSLGRGKEAASRRTPIALVDVRCMFVSVERVLDPMLAREPVIVLSNNDGCAVSRSDEAKALGVRMGDPWFELREKPHMGGVVARSSNYEEYGSFSARFHDTIATLAADVEVYSVDESFVQLPAAGDAAAATAAIQARVRRWTGLPTAAGIGTTKTLAKVAQRHAKDVGVPLCDLSTWRPDDLEELLAATPVDEVWGIGSRLRRGLATIGVHTALDLARADPGVLRRRWSVVLERTARELGGVACMPVGFEPSARQQIMFSRMLGATVSTRSEMRSVLAQYATSATRRLRRYGLEAAVLQAWCSTSRFRDQVEHHSASIALDPPTADPLAIIRASQVVLPKMIEGRPYNRAGIMLTGLAPAGAQPVLSRRTEGTYHRQTDAELEKLAAAVDELGRRYGRQAIGYGPEGLRGRNRWDMRRERLSRAGTTRWDELLTAR